MGMVDARRGDIKLGFKMDTHTQNEGLPVIQLEGEVDVYTAPQLKQRMVELLEGGAKAMVVDLEKVEYLDSTALGVLIGGLKRVREADGAMAVVCPDPRIRRVFEITGLDKIFDMFNSTDEARGLLGKERG